MFKRETKDGSQSSGLSDSSESSLSSSLPGTNSPFKLLLKKRERSSSLNTGAGSDGSIVSPRDLVTSIETRRAYDTKDAGTDMPSGILVSPRLFSPRNKPQITGEPIVPVEKDDVPTHQVQDDESLELDGLSGPTA